MNLSEVAVACFKVGSPHLSGEIEKITKSTGCSYSSLYFS
jgi:hypothetical protein